MNLPLLFNVAPAYDAALAGAAAHPLASSLLAHAAPDLGHAHHSPLCAGFMHPIFGLDHLLAMLTVGLLAARAWQGTPAWSNGDGPVDGLPEAWRSRAACWLLPASFVGLMFMGAALAAVGVPAPGAEWFISASVLVFALALAVLPRVPLVGGAVVVGVFALFHGHAHIAEIGGHAMGPYMAGMLTGTALLHAAGLGVGLLALRLHQPLVLRVAGGVVAAGFAAALLLGQGA